MARKKKITKILSVGLTDSWFDRVAAVADHDRTQVSMAEVVRDCIEAALPGFELALQIRTLDDFDDEELQDLGLARKEDDAGRLGSPELLQANKEKENRAAGCFGGPPRAG